MTDYRSDCRLSANTTRILACCNWRMLLNRQRDLDCSGLQFADKNYKIVLAEIAGTMKICFNFYRCDGSPPLQKVPLADSSKHLGRSPPQRPSGSVVENGQLLTFATPAFNSRFPLWSRRSMQICINSATALRNGLLLVTMD
jgi:hypothetical protein